jgi:hypothetical protein
MESSSCKAVRDGRQINYLNKASVGQILYRIPTQQPVLRHRCQFLPDYSQLMEDQFRPAVAWWSSQVKEE